uniref:Cytokine receptor common subunit beta N-terminal domain-containing protein n=1 Tax=Anas platyrhynchos TaxID=8839 RepID=A0A8B9QMA3_ANAPL
MLSCHTCNSHFVSMKTETTFFIPMQTLHCYPDYNSLTTCTWMECSEAHQFLNMTLNFNHSHGK